MRVTMSKVKWKIGQLRERLLFILRGAKRSKYVAELRYWKGKAKDGPLDNAGYEEVFTSFFGLNREFYAGKKILDIGCGPRGSLEWADMARERIGLDPLADSYMKIGAAEHKMRYVNAYSEAIPFEDGYFDVVSSTNSLDHVDDLDKAISEISRVLAPGGSFLLIVEVNHPATKCEPISFSWNITERFLPEMKLVYEKHYEMDPSRLMPRSVREERYYKHDDTTERAGVLLARFEKL